MILKCNEIEYIRGWMVDVVSIGVVSVDTVDVIVVVVVAKATKVITAFNLI